MNNKEFTSELARRMGSSTKEVSQYLANFNEVITEALEQEQTLNIQGFGTFDVKKKLEHVVTNPSTRQRMLVPPRMEIKFKASSTLKDKMN